LLWACYAYGIDGEDIKLGKNGRPGPYSAVEAGAFVADMARDQNVVFLGSLDEVPFVKGKKLSPKIHNLDWSTSVVSREQILALSKEGGPTTLVSRQRIPGLSKEDEPTTLVSRQRILALSQGDVDTEEPAVGEGKGEGTKVQAPQMGQMEFVRR
jgi:hypothetical protein